MRENCEAAAVLMQDMLTQWQSDAKSLCLLVQSYTITEWVLVKDQILQDENQELLNKILQWPKTISAAKGAALVAQAEKVEGFGGVRTPILQLTGRSDAMAVNLHERYGVCGVCGPSKRDCRQAPVDPEPQVEDGRGEEVHG